MRAPDAQSPRQHGPYPVDLPEQAEDARPPRRASAYASGAILMASLFLLLTNAQALNGWAAEREPSEVMVRVTAATEGWLAATERMRIARPRDWMHAQWKRAQAVRFKGQDKAV